MFLPSDLYNLTWAYFHCLMNSPQSFHYHLGWKDSFLQLCLNECIFSLYLNSKSEKSLTNSNQCGATSLFKPLLTSSHQAILVDIILHWPLTIETPCSESKWRNREASQPINSTVQSHDLKCVERQVISFSNWEFKINFFLRTLYHWYIRISHKLLFNISLSLWQIS